MPKQPQDHQTKVAVFTWTSEHGVSLTLPPLTKVKAGTLRKIRNVPDLDAIFILLEDVCGEDQLEVIDGLEIGELNDMFEAWQGEGDLPQS